MTQNFSFDCREFGLDYKIYFQYHDNIEIVDFNDNKVYHIFYNDFNSIKDKKLRTFMERIKPIIVLYNGNILNNSEFTEALTRMIKTKNSFWLTCLVGILNN